MTHSFVDYHCHLLPGIDDGAQDGRQALDMARILANFGFATVHCTPHLIRGGFENPPDRVKKGTRALQRQVSDLGIDLRLVPGTEHYLDEYLAERLPGVLAVGGSRYLLVEVPFKGEGEHLPALVSSLNSHGLLPLFAHPERCSMFHAPVREDGMFGVISLILGRRREPEPEESLVWSLRESGCRFQGNLGSFAGVYGRVVRQRAIFFLKQGLYSCLGSDAHTPHGLAEILADGFEEIVSQVGESAAAELLAGCGMQAGSPARHSG